MGILINPCLGWVLVLAVESAFPEKREVEQPEILVPHSRNRKGDAVSTSMMSAALTSVLPDYKLIHDTAIVHPDAIIGEVRLPMLFEKFCLL